MKPTIKRILAHISIGSFSLLLIWFVGFMLFLQLQEYRGRKLYGEVKNYPNGYIYEVVNNTIAPVCYISTLTDSTSLKNLYRDFEKYKYLPLQIIG